MNAETLKVLVQSHREGQRGPAEPTGPGAGSGLAAGQANAAFYEGILARIATPLTVAATGSFGRGAVALRSDLDLRFVCAKDPPREEDVEAFLYPLWDARIAVGHQILRVDDVLELALEDVSTATSLLDLRALRGETPVVRALLDRAFEGLFGEAHLAAFLRRLEEEREGRHARFCGSVYLLEPDVKNGAGGLRDLDHARWAARARYRFDPRAPTFRELVHVGVLLPREGEELAAAEDFLWSVRNRLHVHADRRSDRLTFEEQEAIAAELDYGSEPSSVERFMQDYYQHARAVVRGCERILSLATPSPKRRQRPHEMDLGGGVRSFDGQITMTAAADLHTDPALALRVYRTAMMRSMPILPFAREAISRAAVEPAFGEALRRNAEAARLFGELVCSNLEVPTRARSVLGELHDVGLLLAMIPEFCKVTGRVHHDVYHVYTVDVHSVAAVDCLRALARGELVSAHPLASRLALEVAQEGRLYFATLLHDVGKGYPDRDGSRAKHSESGAQLAETIAPRLGFGEADTRAIALLIRNHLAMYHVATRRDLDDPSTIEEFARVVGSREALRNLYLLTVADITTTSPQAMTAWKARMLDELYFLTDAFLSGTRDERPSVRAQVASPAVPNAFSQAFLGSMPERYFLATPPGTIAAHLEVAFARGDDSFALGLSPAQHPSGAQEAQGAAGVSELLELCVVADDRPGLLARIAAALTANRLEVLSAQVYSRKTERGAEAVDVFSLRDRHEHDHAEHRERALRAVRADLRRLLDDGFDPKELVRQYLGRPPTSQRRTPSVTPEVVFDDRASPQHTVVEVFAKDRPGLLFALSQALSELGLTIALSKINTEGAKAADVFYVSDLQGQKLPPARFAEVREALLRCVDPGAAAAATASP